jgi:hypothetical protein
VTCRSTSERWTGVPPEAHTTTGRLGSAGSGVPRRSPTSSLLCSPPTPCPRRPRLRLPVPVASLVAGASSVPYGRRHVRPPTCRASETMHRLSVTPAFLRGEARASQGTGPSSSCVPWSTTPPETSPSSPTRAGNGWCLRVHQDPRHPGSRGVGAAVPRPARSRASASPMALLLPSHGWRPAGRAHPEPGGFRTRWMTHNISWRTCVLQSQLTHRAWSH